MTVSTETNKVSYSGNGTTTVFSYPQLFLAQGDLVVVLKVDSTGVETTQVITTNYTVTGAGDASGGFVTMVTAPASGETLIIYNDLTATQSLNLVENDPLPAESLEQALDRNMLVTQRLKDRIADTIKLAEGFTASFDTSLPGLLTADKTIAINTTGDGFTLGPDASDVASAATNAAAATTAAAAAAVSETNASASEAAAIAAQNKLVPYANDAAFVAGKGSAATDGDAYYDTTNDVGRIYLNGAWENLVHSTVANTFEAAQIFAEQSSAAAPSTGYAKVYPKTDGELYYQDDGGGEKLISNEREAFFFHEESPGTGGGTASATTWHTKKLNVEEGDSGLFTLATNVLTCDVGGLYRVTAYANQHIIQVGQLRLRKTSATAATVMLGCHADDNGGGGLTINMEGQVTLVAGETYEFQHYAQSARATDAFGEATSTGETSRFAMIAFRLIKAT